MSARTEKFKALWNSLQTRRRNCSLTSRRIPPRDEGADPGELSDEWIDEINRRIKAHEKGETTAMPADEFMAKMKAKYG